MNDGIYVELFAVKDGVRYNAKILDMKEMTMILTNGLVDGIEKLWEETKPAHVLSFYNYEKMVQVHQFTCARCGEIMTKDDNELGRIYRK